MGTTRIRAITGSLSSLPSRREVLRGLASAGIVLAAMRHEDDAAARKGHHKKHKKKPKQKVPLPPPPPPTFNEFGCLDVGQPCQGDGTLCCSGLCDPGTATCSAHNSGICFADTDPCTTGMPFPCNPNPNPNDSNCSCTLTTGKAPSAPASRTSAIPPSCAASAIWTRTARRSSGRGRPASFCGVAVRRCVLPPTAPPVSVPAPEGRRRLRRIPKYIRQTGSST